MATIERSLEAQTHVWHFLYRFIASMSLKCAVDLRIPDAIHKYGGRPVTLSRLVADLGIPHTRMSCLRRLMLALTNFGFFRLTVQLDDEVNGGKYDSEEEAFLLTDSSRLLLTDNPHNMTALVRTVFFPSIFTPWQTLSTWFRAEDSPTRLHLTSGLSLWQMTSQMPEVSTMFDEGMASDSRLAIDAVIEKHGQTIFKELTSLVDVGGGNGATATAIARAFPHIKCTVLELPHVVATVPEESKKYVEFAAGDMFEHIPPADAIMLKWILHDWGDEDCVKLLKRCKEAVPPRHKGGKVIIHDMVLSCDLPQQLSEMQYSFDLMMMVLFGGGKERNEREWQKLFSDAGFSGYKILTGLGLRAIIEVYH